MMCGMNLMGFGDCLTHTLSSDKTAIWEGGGGGSGVVIGKDGIGGGGGSVMVA